MFELLRDAIELVPGVSELVIDELSAGLRPATADNVPAIGAGEVPGLYWATGHYRNGILLAPVTAELVAGALARAARSPERWVGGMTCTVNGEPRELPDGTTVAQLVSSLPAAPEGRGVAVALDGEVVPRGAWERPSSATASVEIVAAVQGG